MYSVSRSITFAWKYGSTSCHHCFCKRAWTLKGNRSSLHQANFTSSWFQRIWQVYCSPKNWGFESLTICIYLLRHKMLSSSPVKLLIFPEICQEMWLLVHTKPISCDGHEPEEILVLAITYGNGGRTVITVCLRWADGNRMIQCVLWHVDQQ